MVKLSSIIIFILLCGNSFAQDLKDSIKSDNEGNIHSIWKKKYGEDPIIIDGVVTTNPNNSFNWNISHSIGFAPEESQPTFFVSVSTLISKDLSLGLRGGLYTFQSPLDSAVNDTIRARGPYNAGNYTFTGDYITQGPSYIGALYGAYQIGKNISINGSAGIRMYSEDTWNGKVSFGISSNNSYPPRGTIYLSSNNNFTIQNSESVMKPYFSLGADYKFGSFLIGIYGDNIISIGANIGIGFN